MLINYIRPFIDRETPLVRTCRTNVYCQYLIQTFRPSSEKIIVQKWQVFSLYTLDRPLLRNFVVTMRPIDYDTVCMMYTKSNATADHHGQSDAMLPAPIYACIHVTTTFHLQRFSKSILTLSLVFPTKNT